MTINIKVCNISPGLSLPALFRLVLRFDLASRLWLASGLRQDGLPCDFRGLSRPLPVLAVLRAALGLPGPFPGLARRCCCVLTGSLAGFA